MSAAPDLAHDRRGSGPPLVLLHPLGADRKVWEPVMDRLTAERDVIAVDLPGFGASAVLPGETVPDPPALARTVAAWLSSIGVERPHVAGNSLGGWVALELALAGAARSVCGIAPAGLWTRILGPKPEVARRLARAVRPGLGLLLRSERARFAALAGSVAHPERVPRRAAIGLVRAYAAAPGFSAANAAMRSSRFERLGDIDVPVTLAWCEHDRLIGPPRSLPPHVRSVVLRGCGHIPMWDDPELVARVLLASSADAAEAAA